MFYVFNQSVSMCVPFGPSLSWSIINIGYWRYPTIYSNYMWAQEDFFINTSKLKSQQFEKHNAWNPKISIDQLPKEVNLYQMKKMMLSKLELQLP